MLGGGEVMGPTATFGETGRAQMVDRVSILRTK